MENYMANKKKTEQHTGQLSKETRNEIREQNIGDKITKSKSTRQYLSGREHSICHIKKK